MRPYAPFLFQGPFGGLEWDERASSKCPSVGDEPTVSDGLPGLPEQREVASGGPDEFSRGELRVDVGSSEADGATDEHLDHRIRIAMSRYAVVGRFTAH
ncbi:MAG: hypothetical protein H0W56_01410 [Acidothermales bacterium]|jgi:hypothetical protein|nr:hypothetical protein [Acidothermales bacterium]